MPIVTFLPANKRVEIDSGEDLLQAAAKANIHVNASCGGEGTCGKCKVLVSGNRVDSDSAGRLSETEIAKGYVLACKTQVFKDLTIKIPVESELLAKRRTKIKTLTSSLDSWNEQLAAFKVDPPLTKRYFELTEPSLSDAVSDLTRINRALKREFRVSDVKIDLDIVKKLPDILRDGKWRITVLALVEKDHIRIMRVEPGNTVKKQYALGCDIGTTTCSAQIIDLQNKRILAEVSEYNAQANYGADVISRIVFAKKDKGLRLLQTKVAQTIERMVKSLLEQTEVEPSDISFAVMAGNTIMTHLALGVSTEQIREAPYTPVFRVAPLVTGSDIGLKSLKAAPIFFYPSVASYLGGDITAGVAAVDMLDSEKLTLYIDIGTNGEIVLGNNEWLLGCSCSAGPAFEGAGVKDGIRSIDGAIERVVIEPDTFETVFATIGGHLPIGICGSGLIDLLAELFKSGAVDKRGKFHRDLDTARIREGEYGWEFVVSWAKMTGLEHDIVITEVDIDNLMRAKAAVFAGITTLVESVGVTLDDVQEILIAGSFGNYIKVAEAITIGLLPDLPVERYRFVGNGSLLGAAKAAVSKGVLDRAAEVTRSMNYLELSADPGFMDKYVSALFLPHTDERLFPSVHGG